MKSQAVCSQALWPALLTLGAVTARTAIVCALASLLASPAQSADLSFNRDIRPILADHCFSCHGPDKNQRKADLRLDIREGALGRDGQPGVIVPGSLEQSAIWHRIQSSDPEEQMPPPNTRSTLSPRQIQLLKRWIEEGATWEEHWAWIAPVKSKLPLVHNQSWSKSQIDSFILARLEQEAMVPAATADKNVLLRRAALDLNGIPPNLAELEDFQSDVSLDAFERVIDRLLASPRYGERLGIRWLEAARYADTSGYQNDGPRYMWRWRDWVFDAYNHDLAFDRFTVEQIAGDLLPDATLDQRIASGFNRNHRGNAEGGIIPEEYAVEYVVDRVDTTATVWLGLTLGCARCHEHKFDPFSQREFYQLFAYFNNVPEQGRAIKEGNSPPFIVAPTREDQRALLELQSQWQKAEQRTRELAPALERELQNWQADRASVPAADRDWNVEEGLVLRVSFDGTPPADEIPWKPVPAAHDRHALQSAGIVGDALTLDGSCCVVVEQPSFPPQDSQSSSLATPPRDATSFGYFDPFSISVWLRVPNLRDGTIVSRMTDVEQGDGYSFQLVDGRLQFNLVKRWLDDALRVETETSISPLEWHHLAAIYDGSRVARGVSIYVDGVRQPLRVHLDGLNQTFTAAAEPLRIGGGGGPAMLLPGQFDELRVYARALEPEDILSLKSSRRLDEIVGQPIERPAANDYDRVRQYYLRHLASPDLANSWKSELAARRALQRFQRQLPTVMVMEDMPAPRDSYVLLRGEYNKQGEKVQPGVPAALPELSANRPNNRLAFAEWLVDPRNPLTARIAVNRAWQMLFGTGIVRTVEDFGTQGEPPSHPELLDWLAVHFMQPEQPDRSPWSQKRLFRSLVLSATYQQSSTVLAEALAKDPANRWLGRGPRFRLSAEAIRDQALAASGLLVERIGGPSVKPYQPADLWKELATDNVYETSRGGDLFRRGVYTYWKRTVAPPNLVTFDAAARETCVVRENRTNTPLQALTLLNEITFVEVARNLAQYVYSRNGENVDNAIRDAFKILTSRTPTADELAILVSGWQEHLRRFQDEPSAANALIQLGDSPLHPQLDPARLAAFTVICNLLLSLDETVTRN